MCACPGNIPEKLWEKTQKHPCYSAEAHHRFARIHLPVAPRCNVQCNYCNRKFDCVNESRPGVTSEVLTPATAREKFQWVKEQVENLSVVGIAGPGDALANWPETRQTLEEIRAVDPEVTFCLSTNGLALPELAPELLELGVHHVTVTINAVDPEIGAKIYQFARFQGVTYTGVAAAELLLRQQLAGLAYLTSHGVLVKINIVMIKGVNDTHIPDVVKKVKELGVFVTNIMPLIPASGSAFETFPQTSMQELNDMRNLCQLDIQQMRHCKQCRADAIGLLGEDRSQEFRMCSRQDKGVGSKPSSKKQYKIAVASKHGKLVDQHFGHADRFLIYQGDDREFQLLETRQVGQYCSGMEECDSRAETIRSLQDCAAVVTMRIGYHAKGILEKSGVRSVEYCDTVENGLRFAVEQLALEETQTVPDGAVSLEQRSVSF
ncbi:MAG TPA: nitrogenase cofactor biosynthesis protein NifB [Patescibacteria group bacterium]|nr:nitrogenase cofactor biosynthesis protein NifB [Patescibacteria group bacterium]